jgi:hypothetical protein
VNNGMLIVGFNIEIYFYEIDSKSLEGGKEDWKFIGSINLLDIYNTKTNKATIKKFT